MEVMEVGVDLSLGVALITEGVLKPPPDQVHRVTYMMSVLGSGVVVVAVVVVVVVVVVGLGS
jgi:hypothetical protein